MSEPLNYYSIRVTAAHKFKTAILALECFKKAEWYICYPHTGKHGDNEHFHIAVPAGRGDDKQIRAHNGKFRDAIKGLIGSGNKFFSAKSHKNGIAQFIQYASREGTQPTFTGDGVSKWIQDAPVWVPPELVTGKKRKLPGDLIDHDGDNFEAQIRITYANITQYAVRYYKKNKLEHRSLERTISAMAATHRYLWDIHEKLDTYHSNMFKMDIGEMSTDDFAASLMAETEVQKEHRNYLEAYEIVFSKENSIYRNPFLECFARAQGSVNHTTPEKDAKEAAKLWKELEKVEEEHSTSQQESAHSRA